ncbi:MAG: TonB-dependent receptor [Gammaproteobacteria bacterium]|nr:TonB-dependent receptor [Gammaproteobacteria bacterium]
MASLAGGASYAQDAGAPSQTRSYDIPAGPLGQSLNRFASESGITLSFDPALVEGRTAPALEGSYSVEAGLRTLLGTSGLAVVAGSGGGYRIQGAAGVGAGDGSMRLGPVQVTASRVQRSVSTIPGSVTVLDEEELDKQRQTTRDIQRMLQQSVPGFRGATGTRQEGFNALRGRTALILQNGVPQSVQLRSSGTGINNIDPRMIERIEVARTANATLGFGGAGGTINLITRRPDSPVPLYTLEVGTSFQPHALEGSGLTKEGFASVEGKKGDFDYLFSLSGRDIGELFDADGDRIPDGGTEAKSEEYGVATSLGWQLDPQRSLRLDASYRRVQEDDNRTKAANAIGGEKKAEAVPNNDAFLNPFLDPLQAWNASLTFDDAEVVGSALNIKTFFQRQEINQFSDFTEFGACCVLDRGEDTRIDRRIGARLNIETPLPRGMSLVWGGDLVRNFNSELIDSEVAGTDVSSRPDITQNNFAGFAQIDIPLGDFLLTGGVRHDRFDVDFDDVLKSDGSQFEGGSIDVNETLFNAGLVYFLTDELDLFAGFSQGLDITQPGRAASSVNSVDQIQLEPAPTDSFEVGSRYFGDRWDGSITAFYTDSELSSRTINPGGELQLAIPLRQPERIWGVESTLNVALNEQWHVGGTAAYQEGERKVDGEWRDLQGTFIHPFRLTGYADYNPYDWLSTRLQFEYSPGSNRFPGSTTFGEGEVSDLFLADFIASAQTDYGEFRLGIENLLNKQYVSQFGEATNVAPNFFAQPGITARLTYRLQF